MTPLPSGLAHIDVDALKRRYPPALVDTLLLHADAVDLDAVYTHALERLLGLAPAFSPFDRLALERRTHEAALIKEEVRMFGEMATLLGRITERYSALTGTGRGPAGGQ